VLQSCLPELRLLRRLFLAFSTGASRELLRVVIANSMPTSGGAKRLTLPEQPPIQPQRGRMVTTRVIEPQLRELALRSL
jgi:hypothetical protein